MADIYLVPERKPPIFPISALGSNFSPQNTLCIPAVKTIARLELEKIFRFSFRHYLGKRLLVISPILANLNFSAVNRQPNPYVTLRLKFIEEESSA